MIRLLSVHNIVLVGSTDSEQGVEWVGWWHKTYIFSTAANLPHGRIAYIDLDTVVVNDWSFLVTPLVISGLSKHFKLSSTEGKAEPVFEIQETSRNDEFLVMSAESMQSTEGKLRCGAPANIHSFLSIYF